MKPFDYKSEGEDFNETDNENQEADLDLLIYGNPELPAQMT